jgi:hypothetical protein
MNTPALATMIQTQGSAANSSRLKGFAESAAGEIPTMLGSFINR